MSGGIKLAAGALLHGKAGRLGNIASTAFLVDAGEDLALAIMGMFGGGQSGGRSQDEFGG